MGQARAGRVGAARAASPLQRLPHTAPATCCLLPNTPSSCCWLPRARDQASNPRPGSHQLGQQVGHHQRHRHQQSQRAAGQQQQHRKGGQQEVKLLVCQLACLRLGGVWALRGAGRLGGSRCRNLLLPLAAWLAGACMERGKGGKGGVVSKWREERRAQARGCRTVNHPRATLRMGGSPPGCKGAAKPPRPPSSAGRAILGRRLGSGSGACCRGQGKEAASGV